MSNIVSIVGRPNVGKSTLFNRLTKTRHAIVDSTSGVTRDRHYGKVEWNGKIISVVDTGGYVTGSDDIFEGEIRKQAKIAMEESDLILFMVDVTTGITGMDNDLADILRRSKRKVLVVSNKVMTESIVSCVQRISCSASNISDNIPVFSNKGIDEGRFSNIWLAHYCKPRQISMIRYIAIFEGANNFIQ